MKVIKNYSAGFILLQSLIYVTLITILSMYVIQSTTNILTILYQENIKSMLLARLISGMTLLEKTIHQMPVYKEAWLEQTPSSLVWAAPKGARGLLYKENKIWFVKGAYDSVTKKWQQIESRVLLVYPVHKVVWKLIWHPASSFTLPSLALIKLTLELVHQNQAIKIKSCTQPSQHLFFAEQGI